MLTTYKKLHPNKTTCFDCNGTSLRESIVRGVKHVQNCSTCKGIGELEKGVYIHKSIKNHILLGHYNINSRFINTVNATIVLRHNFSSHYVGYNYNNWSVNSDIEFVAPIDAFLTLKGYMDFIAYASYEQISNFFKVKDAVSKSIAVDSRLSIASKFYDLVQNKNGDDSIFNYFFS